MADLAATSQDGTLLSQERTLRSRLAYVWMLVWRDRGGILGLLVFFSVAVSAIFAPRIAPYDPLKTDFQSSKLPVAWAEGGNPDHLLGTDNLGRDMYSRIIYGARVSLFVSFVGALIAMGIGVTLGAVAGYVGGRLDRVVMAPIELVLSLPYLLFVVFIAAVFGHGLLNVILIFGITNSPIFARVTRGEVMRICKSPYVESAVAAGARFWRILFIHIMPNLIGPLVTLASFQVSAMIFYEAGLGFIGLSVPPSVPSWGNMLSDGRRYLTSYPWLTTIPGLAVVYTSLGMNLLGDWLRDVFDPKLRRARR